ncbi:hypothetical protein M514_04192 [Trichuris suis]|uniref:Uncharacterized protein n=1 Tax=Trichuris suis TaxID=68888 RepID=A0A085NRQ3_9BILA|nr:hypothetical protein M513_04192 [Trichuris suis]KFD72149.1 hypothetical protein M514_04192 [Trichuris suis]
MVKRLPSGAVTFGIGPWCEQAVRYLKRLTSSNCETNSPTGALDCEYARHEAFGKPESVLLEPTRCANSGAASDCLGEDAASCTSPQFLVAEAVSGAASDCLEKDAAS